ncbi:MAG: hypothetical protein WAN43_10025, partial [Rhodomicrobium sp.]
HQFGPGPKGLCSENNMRGCIKLVYLVLEAFNFGLMFGDKAVYLVLCDHSNKHDSGCFVAT